MKAKSLQETKDKPYKHYGESTPWLELFISGFEIFGVIALMTLIVLGARVTFQGHFAAVLEQSTELVSLDAKWIHYYTPETKKTVHTINCQTKVCTKKNENTFGHGSYSEYFLRLMFVDRLETVKSVTDAALSTKILPTNIILTIQKKCTSWIVLLNLNRSICLLVSYELK